MQERHSNRELYYQEQDYTTRKWVIPFIETMVNIGQGTRVLEVGCGEGGNLKPFLEAGCEVIGVDIAANKIENGNNYFSAHPLRKNIRLIAEDIYKTSFTDNESFDLIFLRDTIEHIPQQGDLLIKLRQILKPGGLIFFGFPPWQNPFGGHQQLCESKFLSKLPYFHLLPRKWYQRILKSFGESQPKINGLMEVRDTGLSIEEFFTHVKNAGLEIKKQELFFINPNYEVKFHLKPRRLWTVFNITGLRNFLVTTGYFLVGNSK